MKTRNKRHCTIRAHICMVHAAWTKPAYKSSAQEILMNKQWIFGFVVLQSLSPSSTLIYLIHHTMKQCFSSHVCLPVLNLQLILFESSVLLLIGRFLSSSKWNPQVYFEFDLCSNALEKNKLWVRRLFTRLICWAVEWMATLQLMICYAIFLLSSSLINLMMLWFVCEWFSPVRYTNFNTCCRFIIILIIFFPIHSYNLLFLLPNLSTQNRYQTIHIMCAYCFVIYFQEKWGVDFSHIL